MSETRGWLPGDDADESFFDALRSLSACNGGSNKLTQRRNRHDVRTCHEA
jgi:hypothetical protein